ncbi:MAG TPA: CDP-alcohol phosphatidyltransferase family protein [Chloroflexia bacterium]|nr:CDP-alcohol phosphatidyltransferase family protein [Chloroflexia bacterium]
MANLITLARIILLFATVGLLYLREPWAAFTAAVLTIIVFVSDALDGYVARKRGRADAAGAVFDIAGDRVVENVYWVVCAHLNLVPVWAPLVMLVRSFAVDAVRTLALGEGKTAFGSQTMMQSRLGLWLAASRLHRALYGAAKVIAFVYLILQYGLLLWLNEDPTRAADWAAAWPVIVGVGQALALFSVLYGLARGAVVLYDARGYFLKAKGAA